MDYGLVRKTIKIPSYQAQVKVVSGELEKVNKVFPKTVTNSSLGFTCHAPHPSLWTFWVYFSKEVIKNRDYNTLVHEAAHVVMSLFDSIGVEPDYKRNQEPEAYLMGYIATEMIGFLDLYYDKLD